MENVIFIRTGISNINLIEFLDRNIHIEISFYIKRDDGMKIQYLFSASIREWTKY